MQLPGDVDIVFSFGLQSEPESDSREDTVSIGGQAAEAELVERRQLYLLLRPKVLPQDRIDLDYQAPDRGPWVRLGARRLYGLARQGS